jgi:monofunctional biosynthetic peptidoglycan transglycosylase
VTRALLALLVAAAAWLAFEAWTWPDVASLARTNPRTTAFIERWKEKRRAGGGSDVPDWRWTAYSGISPALKRAVLVAEDVRFFSHHGFDYGELKHAVEDAIEDRELPRGASTITQQLAKNLWLSPTRNPLRKVKEAILTWQLERKLSKTRILELYLNVAELGPGLYGAGAASRRYFGKSPAELSDDEAAQLAASLPNPDDWHPGSGSRAYARHVRRVRKRMESARLPV